MIIVFNLKNQTVNVLPMITFYGKSQPLRLRLVMIRSKCSEALSISTCKILDRISNAIYKPIAIEHVIDENYDTIVEYIIDKNHGFWYEIGKEGKKGKCEWFSGNECDCTDCKGLSVRVVVKGYIKLFLEMQNDGLIQKIESDIDEMEDLPLYTRIDLTVPKYEDDIEEKLQEARNKLASNDWDYSCFFS